MKKLFILTIVTCLTTLLMAQPYSQNELNNYLAKAPFKMPALAVPQFKKGTFDISKYGAVKDGHTLNTDAFKKAIEACTKAGGGTVLVPSGIWLTGPIEMKSNINLHVERGGLILFTKDITQYPIIKASATSTTLQPASPIYGYSLKNIAITGEGIIDGSGEAWRPVKKSKVTASEWKKLVGNGGVVSAKGDIWWPSKQAMDGEAYLKDLKEKKDKPTPEDILPAREFLRPHMVFFVNCENILIENITLRNSPKFVFYPSASNNIIIRYAKVQNEWNAQNGDGIDISASKNVAIYKCEVSVGDDAICMKSSGGKNPDPTSYKLENIVIADNIVYRGHGGFVIGSNTDGNMRNIFVDKCTFIGTDIGIRVKSNAGRGGIVENVYISNITMSGILDEAISFDTYYEDVPAGKVGDSVKTTATDRVPEFRKFFISNVYVNGAETAMLLRGLPYMPIHDIHFKNIHISAQHGVKAEEVAALNFDNVRIAPAKGETFTFSNAKNINMNKMVADTANIKYIKAAGNISNIKVQVANRKLGEDAVEVVLPAERKEIILQ